MKWFGRKSGREGSRPVLARGHGGYGALGEWPQSYEAQVREGYGGNPVAQRAVKIVAEGIASAPLGASDPALVDLVSARCQGQELGAILAAQLLLHGNAFVQILGDGAGGVAALFPLRPERVSIDTDAGGWPLAYRYRVGSSVSRIAAEDMAGRAQVVHLRGFNPVDDHFGLGCLGAASGAVAIHNAATRWNKALLDNAARPSGALVYEPGDGSTLAPAQFERLKAEMEAGFAGAMNAGRPMLLEGGLKWQAMSMTPADMDFVGLKAAAAREIALAFGVPPMLIGLPGDNSYANYREANRAVWRLTILPLADAILNGIAQGLSPWFEGAKLWVEIDKVPAMAEDRERLWRSVPVPGRIFLEIIMTWLQEPLATIALCWRIERRDGVAIGLTAHDRDLSVDGFVYRAAPGMTPSAVKRSAGFDADSMDVTGALSGAAISEGDLLAGRWDGARVALFAVDWTNPVAPVPLGEGSIGAVETHDGVMTAELRGVAAALEGPVVEATSPACRAELGDRRCRVAMAGRRRFARVVSAAGAVLTLDVPAGDCASGRLRWFTGGNSGLEDAIGVSSGASVTLRRVPRFDPVGALVEVSEGCDKSIATCAGRFGNAANFRGEPYLPGIDLLTRYPGA